MLVKTLTCRLSPAQNKELTLSVLALKCFCLAKRGRTFTSCREPLGVASSAPADLPLRLPTLPETKWAVVKLRNQVAAESWDAWHAAQTQPSVVLSSAASTPRPRGRGRAVPSAASSTAAASSPRPHFFLNGEKAPFWDSCVLTSPPIFMQDKQSLVARERAVQGKTAAHTKWADVEEEMRKCGVSSASSSGRESAPVFLFCTDGTVSDRPLELPERVIVIDRSVHAAFFGPLLASRKAMCLSELGAAAFAR